MAWVVVILLMDGKEHIYPPKVICSHMKQLLLSLNTETAQVVVILPMDGKGDTYHAESK